MEKAIFFDTNTLLDLYAYKNDSIVDIINNLNKMSIEYKMIISEQVKDEFRRNYKNAQKYNGNKSTIVKLKKIFDDNFEVIENKIKLLSSNDLYNSHKTEIGSSVQKMLENFLDSKQEICEQISFIDNKDEYGYENDEEDEVLKFVNNLVVIPWTIEKKIKLSIIADQRIKLKLKPGLTDIKKKGDDCFSKYGDQFIWFDILQESGKYKKVVFIENEKKGDWWSSPNSNIIDSLLDKEFNEKNPNTKLEMISFENFIEDFLKSKVQNSTYIEVVKMTQEIYNEIEKMKYISEIDDYLNNQSPTYLSRYINEFTKHPLLNEIDVSTISYPTFFTVEINKDSIISNYSKLDGTLVVKLTYTWSQKITFKDLRNLEYNFLLKVNIIEKTELLVFPEKEIEFHLWDATSEFMDFSLEEAGIFDI